jgi:hypothetical protein
VQQQVRQDHREQVRQGLRVRMPRLPRRRAGERLQLFIHLLLSPGPACLHVLGSVQRRACFLGAWRTHGCPATGPDRCVPACAAAVQC